MVSAGKVQLKVPPVAPTAGVVHVPATLPPVNVAETKVGPVGRTSFNTTFCAVAGPLLTIPIWYDRFEPAGTGSGLSVLVIDRFALCANAEPAMSSSANESQVLTSVDLHIVIPL